MSTQSTRPSRPARPATVLALDMGGTHLRHVVATSNQDLAAPLTARLHVSREASERDDPVQQIRRLVQAVDRDRGPLQHVVIGLPGVVHDGRLLDAPNLLPLQDTSALERLRTALPCPVTFMNDCNLAALGEGGSDLAFIAIGTGLGCGLIRQGRVMPGAHGQAGELGLLPMPDGSVLEDLLSGPGIRRRHDHYGGSGDVLTDPGPAGEHTRRDVQAALASLLQVLTLTVDPASIVFGGGVGQHLGAVIAAAWSDACTRLSHVPRPTLSRHGDNAALVGGLRLALTPSGAHHG
ncbi:ROK family protein [Deinococcus sp.]|uniref:ROK family protein n=1 Tax=Deinococcus sp. TaxID=47478 RepID=UPI0028699A40|nr:ROK family protein [Deinococcus sp.]